MEWLNSDRNRDSLLSVSTVLYYDACDFFSESYKYYNSANKPILIPILICYSSFVHTSNVTVVSPPLALLVPEILA